MEDIRCPNCNGLLNTEDIWCYSTVTPERIVIAICCFDCQWYAYQDIDFVNFKEIASSDLARLPEVTGR